MLRSMYSGISGMKANQTKLDVIGNNISNVGTTAFKASSAKFKDMLSQNISGATSPTSTQGGRNAAQVGLGVQLSSIDTIMTQGNLQTTNRSLDVAIDDGYGNQFFMVSKGPSIYGDSTLEVSQKAGSHGISDQSLSSSGAEIMYTRDGGFILDTDGSLLTSDGYRILGYSLTNDDNAQAPTGQSSSTVSTAGMDFRFGPGSQLNGYTVTLGTICKGTATDAEIDKTGKRIIISGDFSEDSTLKADQITSAINKALSSAGISQRVDASGTPTPVSNTSTGTIEGGSEATAPTSVNLMGMTFKFGKGEQLNDYTIKIGSINSGSLSVDVDDSEDTKTITINGNFIEKGALTPDDVARKIQQALKAKGITQDITGTGSISQVSGLNSKSDDSGKDYSIPGGADNKIEGTHGLTITFERGASGDACEKGGILNGYSFSAKQDTTLGTDAYSVSVNKESKSVEIKFNGSPDLTNINTEIATKLGTDYTNEVKLTVSGIPLTSGTSDTAKVTSAEYGNTTTAPKSVTVGGFTLKFPEGKIYNGVNVQICDLDGNDIDVDGKEVASGGKKVQLKTKEVDGKKYVTDIFLSGDFKNGTVTETELQDAINSALTDEGITQKPEVSGSAKTITGLTSNSITGGISDAAPEAQTAFGMTFSFGNGSALNGYSVKIGKVTAGTQTSVDIDTTGKSIILNGDFANGKVTSNALTGFIRNALANKGIDQEVKVTNNPTSLSGIESEKTTGGTPTQSINADGSITYVNGSQDVKAYDGSLKSLKIPDAVIDPATGQSLKVQSFTIEKSGVIKCKLEGGSTAAVGQIAMASFKNAEGLTKNGGNLYSMSANSGSAIVRAGVGTTGDDNSGAFGNLEQSKLEVSNVDLAEQFTEMITTTRSFQASSKMINTGDEILQDIINLKR